MAWNKLPKSHPAKGKLDRFDLEAEAEGSAMASSFGPIGPVGKKTAKTRSKRDRGESITERKSLRHIEVG